MLSSGWANPDPSQAAEPSGSPLELGLIPFSHGSAPTRLGDGAMSKSVIRALVGANQL